MKKLKTMRKWFTAKAGVEDYDFNIYFGHTGSPNKISSADKFIEYHPKKLIPPESVGRQRRMSVVQLGMIVHPLYCILWYLDLCWNFFL